MKHLRFVLTVVLLAGLLAVPTVSQAEDDALPDWVEDVNAALAARGLNMAVAQIDYFTIGNGRSPTRILQLPFRWVSGDERRLAQGDDITYMVDQGDGATASGLTSAQTELAIDSCMATWDASKPLKKVDLVKRADDGNNNEIWPAFFGYGTPGGFPFAADVVFGGWMPRGFFEAFGGPGGGDGILAVSVTFIFLDDETGLPSDINGDNYLDTALNEVYFNDTFGDPANTLRVGNPWKIDAPERPEVDVETVALHEAGHSLGIGHFGPPPTAVLNPHYGGMQQTPLATDLAAMHTIWSRWPK